MRERNGSASYVPSQEYVVALNNHKDKFYAPTLAQVVEQAYDAAYPTRPLEPGDLFIYTGIIYMVDDKSAVLFWDSKVGWSKSHLGIECYYDYAIIGKAFYNPIEAKSLSLPFNETLGV